MPVLAGATEQIDEVGALLMSRIITLSMVCLLAIGVGASTGIEEALSGPAQQFSPQTDWRQLKIIPQADWGEPVDVTPSAFGSFARGAVESVIPAVGGLGVGIG